MFFRRGQVVTSTNHGGLWKVIDKTRPDTIFGTCERYTIQSTETGEILTGVRDKDILGKKNAMFQQFVQLKKV